MEWQAPERLKAESASQPSNRGGTGSVYRKVIRKKEDGVEGRAEYEENTSTTRGDHARKTLGVRWYYRGGRPGSVAKKCLGARRGPGELAGVKRLSKLRWAKGLAEWAGRGCRTPSLTFPRQPGTASGGLNGR